MSDQLVPSGQSGHIAAAGDYSAQMQAWEEPRGPVPALAKSPLERPVSAVRRYKWLMLAVIVLSMVAGVGVTRYVTPQFDVRASIMIASDAASENGRGPIRSAGLLGNDDWATLLRSFVIADAVVRKLSLYLSPDDGDQIGYFKGFSVADAFRAGRYEVTIDKTNKRWTLVGLPPAGGSESGGMTDSVGRKIGFLWTLPSWAFSGRGEQKIRFTVATPRETAVQLISRVTTERRATSNFLALRLSDPDGELAARILNTWVNEFVAVASTLKKRKLSDFAMRLSDQLRTAKNTLDSAEVQLSAYRVNTITLPSEGGSGITPGLQETRDPVVKDFFTRRIEYEDVKRDVKQLESLIGSVAHDSVPSDALLEIRSVSTSPATVSLRSAIQEFHTLETDLAKQSAILQDEHPTIKSLRSQLVTLKRNKIPQYATELLRSLREREREDSLRIDAAGDEMKKIPERTIEEERLRRIRDIASGLYTNLQNRYAEAQLAEASASPDVSVLDSAVAPLEPTKNTAPRVIMISIIGGIGAAFVLAILLDRLDKRLRYPEQATDELGLAIAGAIPRFPKDGVSQTSPEQTFQLIEAFRSLRMSVMQAATGGAVSVAVSSPSPAEGKSLIAANLAMSFADAGLRTVLVDGDTRRGKLHEMFEMNSAPGLTEYLSADAELPDILRATSHPQLRVIPGGTRKRRSPELLTTRRLPDLVAELRATNDVVIFDTPPLAAGIDGYSIATATGNLVVVLRVGQTARRMAAEKLRLFDRLPVNIVGAVLNGVQAEDGYGYYGYVPGYDAVDEESDRTDLAGAT